MKYVGTLIGGAGLIAGGVTITSLPAQAFGLQLNSSNGRWTSVTGGGSTVTGVNTNLIRWGGAANVASKSGLQYVGSSPASIAINTPFLLGTLTHFNFPVDPPFASAANLALTLNVSSGVTYTQTFNYGFSITETTNRTNVQSCPVATQISSVPCDDVIRFNNAQPNESLVIAGNSYQLRLLGFTPNLNGSSLTSQFTTTERQQNNTYIFAEIRTTSQVPEPLTIFGSAIALGFAIHVKRKLKKSTNQSITPLSSDQ